MNLETCFSYLMLNDCKSDKKESKLSKIYLN